MRRIASFLPVSGRHYLFAALNRSKLLSDKHIAYEIAKDAVEDATGSRPEPDAKRKVVMDLFMDLRWTLTGPQADYLENEKYPSIDEDGKRVKKMVFYKSWYDVYDFDKLWRELVLPETLYENTDACFFSHVVTRAFLVEFGWKFSDDWTILHILFYIGFLATRLGEGRVNAIVIEHSGTFLQKGFLQGEIGPNFFKSRILPFLNRILKERQTYSVDDVSTPFTRTIGYYEWGFKQNIYEDEVLESLEQLFVDYQAQVHLVIPATLLALGELQGVAYRTREKCIRAPRENTDDMKNHVGPYQEGISRIEGLQETVKMDFKKAFGWDEQRVEALVGFVEKKDEEKKVEHAADPGEMEVELINWPDEILFDTSGTEVQREEMDLENRDGDE